MTKEEIVLTTKRALKERIDKVKEQREQEILKRLPEEEKLLVIKQIEETALKGFWQTRKEFKEYRLASDLKYWLEALGFVVEAYSSHTTPKGFPYPDLYELCKPHSLIIRWDNEE